MVKSQKKPVTATGSRSADPVAALFFVRQKQFFVVSGGDPAGFPGFFRLRFSKYDDVDVDRIL